VFLESISLLRILPCLAEPGKTIVIGKPDRPLTVVIPFLAALRDAINATWEHRHQLKPATDKKQAPRHLDVFALLPQTNCRQCGEATCLAFAVNLILGNRLLEECIPLQRDAAYNERRATLEAML